MSVFAYEHKKNLAIALMKPPLQRLKTLNDLSVTKDHCKNLHAPNLKNHYIFFVAVYYHLVLNGKLKLDLQPVLLDRPF